MNHNGLKTLFLVAISFFVVNGVVGAPEKGRPQAPHHAPAAHAAPHPAPAAHHPVETQRRAPTVRPSVSRTPSMSRVGSRPNRPAVTAHPSLPQRERVRQVQQQIGQKVARPVNKETRSNVRQFLDQSKQRRLAVQPREQGQRKREVGGKPFNQQEVSRVRDRVRHDHPDHERWFDDSFFERHHYYPFYYNPGIDFWAWPTWSTINVWLSLDQTPIYYGGEGDYPIEQPLYTSSYPEPQTEYAGQTENAQPAEGDWLPLGVFAAGQDITQASLSNKFVQLAVSKDGDLAGTYYNATTDQTYQLEGIVDSETQQAAWKIADKPDSPLMTTGIYDLTQDVANVLVQFPDGSEQTWVLVRLQK